MKPIASGHRFRERPLHGRAAGGGGAHPQSRSSRLPAEIRAGAIESGFVASLIEKHAVEGLTVAAIQSSWSRVNQVGAPPRATFRQS
jgi:hypothetical protein